MTGVGGADRMEALLLAAQEMGGPLNVVIGRMEYLLKRGADKKTVHSLNAIRRRRRMNSIWHAVGQVETPPGIGYKRSRNSKQDSHRCEVDRMEIPDEASRESSHRWRETGGRGREPPM